MSPAEGERGEAAAEAASVPTKGGGDFLKTYVVVLAVLAAVLVMFDWNLWSKKAAFEKANEQAQKVFGGPTLPAEEDERPTTVRALAVGIHKYLQTYQGVPKGSGETAIPIQQIRQTADALQLKISVLATEQTTPYRSKGFEEVSTTITFEATDLERLSTFLYNLESKSTKIRILDVRWDLKADRENPYQPGTAPGFNISAPTVKVGFRRPIMKGS